jgi:hypothetical protein
MSRNTLFAGVALVAAVAFAPSLSAQALSGPSCTPTLGPCVHTLNANVPELINLTLERPATDLGTIGASQFDLGQRIAGPLFEVKANRGYDVLLTAGLATFSGTGNPAKPATDVQFARVLGGACAGATGFAALSSSTSATIFSGTAGLSPRQQLCFNIAWDYADDGPGTYSLPLNLSVVAP